MFPSMLILSLTSNSFVMSQVFRSGVGVLATVATITVDSFSVNESHFDSPMLVAPLLPPPASF